MSQHTTEYLVREITQYLKHSPEAANELLAAVAEGMAQFRLEVQEEVGYLYQAFNAEQYKLIEWEVVNRDGGFVLKQDILIGSRNVCYKDEHGQLLVVYLNGRQNIQEEHFSDLLLRKEV